jgi:mannan endo-1,4-beta-mannosidase
MDVYTINLGGKYHDDVRFHIFTRNQLLTLRPQFYTKPNIIAAFKNYIKAVVTRYKDSEAIFSWELGELSSVFDYTHILIYCAVASK